MKDAEYYRNYRKKRIEKQLCIVCGKENDNLPKKNCKVCAARRANSQKKYRHKLMKENKCQLCKDTLDREGIYCSKCLDIMSEKNTSLLGKRLYNGLCSRCGKPLDRESYCCSKCAEKARNRRI